MMKFVLTHQLYVFYQKIVEQTGSGRSYTSQVDRSYEFSYVFLCYRKIKKKLLVPLKEYHCMGYECS